jgi:hypothetical protein
MASKNSIGLVLAGGVGFLVFGEGTIEAHDLLKEDLT